MRANLLFASLVTLGILAGFIFFVFYLIAFWARMISFPVLIALTVITNIVLWLINPMVTDWLQSIFYRVRWVPFEEFQVQHGEVAGFLQQVCEKHSLKVPRLRIIGDLNPTAYCYGSYPDNSRIVISEGIFKYLDVEEQKAVIGHELGHIINKDFIIMTIAVTLLQILYEVSFVFLRARPRRGGKGNGIIFLIGFISFILYLVGSYLILYLSRTREYLADRFSATETKDPDALSMALIKIAYGIAVETETDSAKRLLNSTRALGICDVKSAHTLGTAFKVVTRAREKLAAKDIIDVFLFDLVSPWALVAEINSTHPLTGKRIRALSGYATHMGKISNFDFEEVMEKAEIIDKSRLYHGFAIGVMIYLLPIIAILAGFGISILQLRALPFVIVIVGLAFLIQGLYKFRRIRAGPEKTTILELMRDPYANPLRGRYVELEGIIIGKADAGSYLGEDLKMQDGSDCLIYLNYEAIIPFFGDLYFGLTRAAKMIGQSVVASGWFRRSSYQVVDLDSILVNGEKVKSYTRFWGIILGMIVLVAGLSFAGLFIPLLEHQTTGISHANIRSTPTPYVVTTRPLTYALVRISSNPPGAEVLFKGHKWGTTPLEAGMAPGQYTITFRHPGYEDSIVTVNAVIGQNNISADLVPLPQP